MGLGAGLETVQMLNARGQQALPDGMQVRGIAVHEHTAPDTWTETTQDNLPVVEADSRGGAFRAKSHFERALCHSDSLVWCVCPLVL